MTVEGEKGHWRLLVNGKPFELKGAGLARGTGKYGGINYFQLAKEMGVNCVRTWGINQGDKGYLDKAHGYGLFVDAGIWMEWVDENKTCSYVISNDCKNKLRKQTLNYVRKFKDHPAVLFWNIGNETINFTKEEEERIAFAKFLEELIREVKAIDPNHPIIYTSAYTSALNYIDDYVPSLEIFGVNLYGGFDSLHDQVTSTLDIPYIVTEYGPLGPWDQSKDVNGRPYEATDRSKVHNYNMLFRAMTKHQGYNLGGFVFSLGDTTQNSFTWWNLTHRQYKKLSYLTMQSIFTGHELNEKIPHVNRFTLSKQKDLLPEEQFSTEVIVHHDDPSELQYLYFASTDIDHIPMEYPNDEIPLEIEGEGPTVKIKAPINPGIYRIYVLVVDHRNHASTLSKTISVISE